MNKVRIICLLLILSQPIACIAGSLERARKWEKQFLSAAIKVEAVPTCSIGTGFLTKLEQLPDKYMFTTCRHLLNGADGLKLIIPIQDTSKVIVGNLTFTIELYQDTTKLYHVPYDNMDIAVMILERELIHGLLKLERVQRFLKEKKLNTIHFFTIPTHQYADVQRLFAGQPVLFSGYPFGMSVDGTKPLLRKGSIAGIDTTTSIIYLDADAFGGSSGSPVFLDFSYQVNLEFLDNYHQMLVGVIFGYLRVEKENSGIALAIPAEKIREIADSLLPVEHRR